MAKGLHTVIGVLSLVCFICSSQASEFILASGLVEAGNAKNGIGSICGGIAAPTSIWTRASTSTNEADIRINGMTVDPETDVLYFTAVKTNSDFTISAVNLTSRRPLPDVFSSTQAPSFGPLNANLWQSNGLAIDRGRRFLYAWSNAYCPNLLKFDIQAGRASVFPMTTPSLSGCCSVRSFGVDPVLGSIVATDLASVFCRCNVRSSDVYCEPFGAAFPPNFPSVLDIEAHADYGTFLLSTADPDGATKDNFIWTSNVNNPASFDLVARISPEGDIFGNNFVKNLCLSDSQISFENYATDTVGFVDRVTKQLSKPVEYGSYSLCCAGRNTSCAGATVVSSSGGNIDRPRDIIVAWILLAVLLKRFV